MSINIVGLSKMFGSQKALNDVSFQVHTGEIVGFLGPNGAGKSTLMKIITGYMPATSGKVFINGVDMAYQNPELRKLIGYLPEQNPLYPEMYITEYLAFSAKTYGIRNAINQRVQSVVDRTGLGPERHKKIGQLSKGYRQRVGLAQAIIHDPQILLLDEPTSGLDPNQLVEIRRLIADLGREKTVMFSTHIMQEAKALCKRIVIIKLGKIVADADIESLPGQTDAAQSLVVEIAGNVQEHHWLAIAQITRQIQLTEGRWILETDSAEDIRPLVFKLAVNQGWTVLGLQKQEKSLETVFQELTK